MLDSTWTNFLTWASTHTGDIPTWIMAILTPVSIGVGLYFTKKQLKENETQLKENEKQLKRSADIEENKFLIEIDNKLMREDNLHISQNIYNELYLSTPFVINSLNESDVSNYLTDLEYVCNLYNDGILTKDKLIRNSYDDQIKDSIRCNSIKNFIDAERTRTGKPHYFKILEDLSNTL